MDKKLKLIQIQSRIIDLQSRLINEDLDEKKRSRIGREIKLNKAIVGILSESVSLRIKRRFITKIMGES